MSNTYTLFSIANVFILLNWLPLLFAPKSTLTQKLIHFPFIPLLLSLFYLFFLISCKYVEFVESFFGFSEV